MAVDDHISKLCNFIQHLRHFCKQPWIVHHFCKAQNTRIIFKNSEILSIQMRTRCFKWSRRYATRKHKINVHRKVFRRINHKLDTWNACNICNFVRIHYSSSRTKRDYCFCKFRRDRHRAFNVHMSVSKTWSNKTPISINNYFCIIVLSYSYNNALMNQYILFFYSFVKYIYNPSVFN